MKTKNITFGAMLCALYGVYFLINLQTADLLGSFFYLVINIPLAMYTLKFDKKSGLTVYFSTIVLAFMLLPLTSWLLIVPNLLVGVYVADAITREKTGFHVLFLASLLWIIEMLFTILGGMYLLDLSLKEIIGIQEILSFFGININIDYIAIIPTFLMFYGIFTGITSMNIIYLVTKRLNLKVKELKPIKLFDFSIPKTIALLWLGLEIMIFFNYNSYIKAISLLIEVILAIFALINIIKVVLLRQKDKRLIIVVSVLFLFSIKIYAFIGVVIRFFYGKKS